MGDNNIVNIPQSTRKTIALFRTSKFEENRALLLKIDREQKELNPDGQFDGLSIEEVTDILPSHQPRYIIYSCKMTHDDGRVSYPMCLIFYTPRDSQMELQVLYAATKINLQVEARVNKVFEVREIEDLTEEWLRDKLK